MVIVWLQQGNIETASTYWYLGHMIQSRREMRLSVEAGYEATGDIGLAVSQTLVTGRLDVAQSQARHQ